MSSLRLVPLADVWAMLNHCAPGHERMQKLHHWWITWRGKTYRGIPLGEHGRRKHTEVEVGHVRGMVNHLLIPKDCVAVKLPFLYH